jgi:hypothetical protein
MTDEYLKGIESQNLALQLKLEDKTQFIDNLPYDMMIIMCAFGIKKSYVQYNSPAIIHGYDMLLQYFAYAKHEGVAVSDHYMFLGWGIQTPHFVAINRLVATPKNQHSGGAIYSFTDDFNFVDDWKYNEEIKKWEPYLSDNSMIFNAAFTERVKQLWNQAQDMKYVNPYGDGRVPGKAAK